VIIDPHHTLDSITLAALDNADDILLVSTLDVSAIRSAQRSMRSLIASAIREKKYA